MQGDESGNLIGRFSTSAKLDLVEQMRRKNQSPFQWYEFKFGEKRAGELLAVFELIEINPVNSSMILHENKISFL